MTGVNWKTRYVELLDQQEKQQLRYKKKNHLLSQALAHATSLAKGFDDVTDEKMRGLQALLRRDSLKNVDLESAVLSLAKHADKSTATRQTEIQAMLAEMASVSKQLRSASDSKEVLKFLKDYEKQLQAKSKQLKDVTPLLSQLSQIHKKALEQISQQTPKTSLLANLFGGAKPATKTIATKVPTDTDDQDSSVAPKGPLNTQTAPANSEVAPVTNLSEPLLKELKQLLEKAISLELLESNYAKLYRKLDQSLEVEQVPALISKVGQLIVKTLQDDKADFEAFLGDINDQLLELNSNLQATKSIHDSSHSATEKFSRAMQAGVGKLRSSISGSTDLNSLKEEVSSNVQQMMAVVDSHVAAEGDRHGELTQELERLSNKIVMMEQVARVTDRRLQVQQSAARTDPLTKLPNREAYKERASKEIARWQRHQRPLCVAICDIDFFKKVNDSYGHIAGDLILVEVAKSIAQRLRENDFVARFGGEEFVLLLPETNEGQALLVMESLRQVIAGQVFEYESQQISITISIGIAGFQGKDNLESAFTRADKALYTAKNNGRDQCQLAEAP